MYIPKYSEIEDQNFLYDFIEKYNFAILVTQEQGTSFANHLPLLLERSATESAVLWGHLARNNPHYQSFKEGKEVL